MELTSTISTKLLDATVPGELIRISVRTGPIYAIVIDMAAENHVVLGSLVPYGEDVTFHRRIKRQAHVSCVSYGTGFAVEPLPGDETWAGNNALRTASGCLLIDGARALMCFPPSENDLGFDPVYFDLGSNEYAEPSQGAAPIARWRIWEDAAKIGRQGAAPLVEINAIQ